MSERPAAAPDTSPVAGGGVPPGDDPGGTPVRVRLPQHLRTLAGAAKEEVVLVPTGVVSQRALVSAIEARWPPLRGTLRDPSTGGRRAFVRYFACQEDLSHEPLDAPLPDAVLRGDEPLLVLGAMAGG